MAMQQKENFLYAKLYNSKDNNYYTDSSVSGLVMGPETAKRFQENTEQIAVTVCCITYNHEEYIRQALDSFLMQKTNFKYQVFVGEDHGSDGTANIVREYGEKYPDIIVPFLREENMGAQRNLIDLCQHAKSPYIAFCEGDDYWIDEYKLQKQYDYMQTHEDIRMCYTRTEILAPDDWHLNSYYKHDKDGRMIIPDCIPNFKEKRVYTAKDFIYVLPNHTSTAFYRWNYDLNIPDWYYEGMIGDTPLTFMQIGMGKAVYLPDITSVYRRSDVGVFMNNSTDEHFANTRLDYVRLLSGLRSYFEMNFNGAYSDDFRERITKEIANYLSTAEKFDDITMVETLIQLYPEETIQALHTYMGTYNIYQKLKRILGDSDFKNVYETRKGAYFTIPGIKIYDLLHNVKVLMEKCIHFVHTYILGWFRYWKNSLIKKEKNLWVFTGFRSRNYTDNSKYFYDYIVKYHPEINAVWLTLSGKNEKQLKEEGKPVMLINSEEGRKTLAHAEIAVTDHFVTSDYNPLYGFNAKTKVVQLWHGVGFKSMGDENGVKNTKERGVQYSQDILAQEGDGFLTKIKKKVKYFFVAPFRELFEEYFMFVCPGQERIDMIAKIWKIPEKSWFMAGHPRDLPVYQQTRQLSPIKIIYAPTYRFNYKREDAMVREFLDVTPQIQELMDQIDGEFYIRLHPHTWRNYDHRIMNVLKNYDRIFQDKEPDISQSLGTYSVMITDYSSVAVDFAMLNRPVIFLGADYEWFIENEAGFNLDFLNVIPGPMTKSWDETLQKVCEYVNNPDKDSELREKRCEYFYDSSVNGPDNSERIVQEIKRRISLD